MIEIDREINILLKYNLSFEQWGFLRLIWLCEQEGGAKYLYKYFHERKIRHKQKEGIPQKELEDLIDRKFIQPFNIERSTTFDQFRLTRSFVKDLFVDANVAGEELWDAYPPFMSSTIEGKRLPAKNISKHYNSLDSLFIDYGKAIKFDVEKHKEVLKSLQLCIDKGELNFSIVEWIISRKWEEYVNEEPVFDFIEDA